jgi:hypothetical protein
MAGADLEARYPVTEDECEAPAFGYAEGTKNHAVRRDLSPESKAFMQRLIDALRTTPRLTAWQRLRRWFGDGPSI